MKFHAYVIPNFKGSHTNDWMYYKMTKMFFFLFCLFSFWFFLSFPCFFLDFLARPQASRGYASTRCGLTAEMFLIRHKIDGQHSPMTRPCPARPRRCQQGGGRLCLMWDEFVNWWRDDWLDDCQTDKRTDLAMETCHVNAGGDAHSTAGETVRATKWSGLRSYAIWSLVILQAIHLDLKYA